MAQVKKEAVREAILANAFALFSAKGYSATTLAEIAAGAGVATSNIYVYFASKLEILFAIYQPWLIGRLERLDDEIAAINDPRERLRAIFLALWRDIPEENNGFAHNLMQAVSTATPEDRYSRDLLLLCEARVSEMIRNSLPPDRLFVLDRHLLSHLAFMAFDGFVINVHLKGPSERVTGIADLLCDLLLGRPAGTSQPPGDSKRTTADPSPRSILPE